MTDTSLFNPKLKPGQSRAERRRNARENWKRMCKKIGCTRKQCSLGRVVRVLGI